MSGNYSKNFGAGHGSHLPIPSIEEKNKQLQLEIMMEKLRAKHRNKPRSYDDIKKSMRNYFLEKSYPIDPLCQSTLRTALDKLQNYIKVTSRHGLVERLESLSRHLGLKFMEDQQMLFISTDMFYVEILLDAKGNLNDVKVHHECKSDQPSSSSASNSELLNCLKAGDFTDFSVQLEGLSSIYQLDAEPKVKKKAYVALEAMETDICSLYQQQLQLHRQLNNGSDSYQIMNSSSVGLVLERRGGHPLKLTYFCPPLHLIEKETKTKGDNSPTSSGTASRDLSIEEVIKSPSSMNVTLNLEASSASKLQIMPTVSFTSDSGLPLDAPSYAPLTQNNSMLMPATYVLRLSKPIPVCIESLRALGLPGLANVTSSDSSTIMNLIVQTASKQAFRSMQKGLYVNLYKETHCYFLTENRRLQGTMISSLQFTEPAQVPKIIAFLKKQTLFCSLLSSCVRDQQKHYNDMDSTVILEVTAVSLNQITVELQHPYEESLATVDFLLEDGQATCTIYCLNNDYEDLSQKLTRTVRQVVSIPMVIYKLLRCWDEEHTQKVHGGPTPGTGTGASSGAAGGFNSSGGSTTSNFGQFAMETGPGDGSSGGFTSISSMKMDSKARSLADAFAASTSAAAAIAGLMNLKRETDPNASGGSSPVASTSSAGSASASKSNEHEIADKYKNIWKDKTPNLKHSVSITPIAGDGKSPVQQQVGGIEIIPLNAPSSSGVAPATGSPATTITITPITGAGKESSSKESKKSSSSGSATKRPHESGTSSSSTSSSTAGGSSSSSEAQKEKKRKKKRDDSPMGPPEKVYSRQNSPAGGGMSDASTSSGVVRKFSSPSSSSSSSPKAGVGSAMGLMAGQPSARPSPKHSPVYSSPKHSHSSSSNTASNSPKSPFGTHSPKHGSSGKPSMSTLKSATAATSLSLSPKADKTSSSSASGGVGSGSSSSSHSLPLPIPLSMPSSSSGCSSGTAPSMMRPVPPLATSSGSQLSVAIKKEKSMGSSSSSSSGASSGAVAAAVAALKSSQQQQQQQQQMKPSVSSLSHLASGGNLGSYANPGVSALELNAIRKGMAAAAGAGVGPGMGAAAGAGAVGAVSLMTSTPVSTTTTAVAGAATTTAAAAATGADSSVSRSAAATGTGAEVATTATQQQLGAGPHSSDSSSSSSSTSGAGTATASSTEYMVKPSSQEGLKLTINKTGSSSSGGGGGGGSSKKESKSGPSSSGSSSTSSSSSSAGVKKQHTGLKPGVNSGPASKKAAAAGLSGSSSTKLLFQKANSSGSLSTKLSSGSSSHSTSSGGLPLTKSNSTNSFQDHSAAPKRRPSMCNLGSGSSGAGGSGAQRKTPSGGQGSGTGSGGVSPAASSGSMSQPPPRFDHHTDMMTILQYASPSMAANMEGFIKGLHNKFQIPKLSHRTAGASGSSGATGRTTPSTEQTTTSTTDTVTASSTSSSTATQDQQLNADISALAASISTTSSSSSGIGQRSLSSNTTSGSGSGTGGGGGEARDGIDEDLLASLAGE